MSAIYNWCFSAAFMCCEDVKAKLLTYDCAIHSTHPSLMPSFYIQRTFVGSDTMLPQRKGIWGKMCHRLRKIGQVSQHHPLTYDHFFSFPAVMAERQRQLYEGGSYLIHPFSMFSLAWKSFMVFLNLAHMVLSTFRLFYIVDPHYHHHLHSCDIVLMVLNFFCWLDIGINFNTGYVETRQDGSNIVLDRQLILCNYLRKWFIWDLASTVPLAGALVHHGAAGRRVLAAHLLPLIRAARVYTVAVDLTTFIKVFTRSYVWYGVVRHVVLFWLTAHWCSCIIYLPAVFTYYWHDKFNKMHTQFLNLSGSDRTMLDASVLKRYTKSIFISLSGFFGTGFSMFLASEPDEVLMHSLIILYSSMYMVYNFVFLLKVYILVFSATVRYHELMNQVEEYMKLKQFPVPLKKRVRAFYYYRYQEQYFNEHTVLTSLSDELRNEIKLHTCHKLVDKVAVFKDVPASVVGSVLGCLHTEVYLPNDSVQCAGDIGDCMYFIASGTVAIYSLKGVEVCHLEDGAHFGEVALIMKDSKRVATVVAVEITQLYRLDRKDFKSFVLSNELLFKRVEALASKRMHETVLVDEDLRRERERLQEKKQSFSSTL